MLGVCEEGQERFLDILSRGTGGVCRTILPGESTEESCHDLAGILGGCVASELRVTSTSRSLRIQPELSQAVFAGCPLVIMGDTDIDEVPQFTLTWSSEGMTKSLALAEECPTKDLGETVALLRGARLIVDCQGHGFTTDDETRKRLKALSQRFGLASREMSLVAVVKRQGDELLEAPKTEVVAAGVSREYLSHLFVRFSKSPGPFASVQYFINPQSGSYFRREAVARPEFHFLTAPRDFCDSIDTGLWTAPPVPGEGADEAQWIAEAAHLLTMLHDCQGRFSRRFRRNFNDILNRLEQSPHASGDPRCQSLLSWFREQNRHTKPLSFTTEQVAMLDTVIDSANNDGQLTDWQKDEFWKIVSTLPGITMPSA